MSKNIFRLLVVVFFIVYLGGYGKPFLMLSFAEEVEKIFEAMSVEQKVGQIMVVGVKGKFIDPEISSMIEHLHIGGVILFENNVSSFTSLRRFIISMQKIAQRGKNPGLFICVDQEGGRIARLKEDKGFTEFPSAMAVAATGNIDNVRGIARSLSCELKALGINVDLAPVLDVNNNPSNPVIGIRSYGSYPSRVSEFGCAFIEALQEEGIMAVGKHFPGHGDTSVDSHVSLPVVSHQRERLETVELAPFKAAMKSGVAGIMSAHVLFLAIDSAAGVPATLSSKVLRGLLRGELGFEGLIFTDSLEMGALKESGHPLPEAAVEALNAGADILLFNVDYATQRRVYDFIVEKVKSGQVSQDVLDIAVKRVLTAKARFGILKNRQYTDSTFHWFKKRNLRMFSRKVAQKSITLLRDNADLLPLKPNKKAIVIETDNNLGLRRMLGITALQVGQQPDMRDINNAVNLCRNADVVIVATTDVEKNLRQAVLVNELLKVNRHIIVVAMHSPYDLLYFKDVPAYLVTYGSSPPSVRALADVLKGKIPPKGHLPVELN